MTKPLISNEALKEIERRRVNLLSSPTVSPAHLRDASDDQLLEIQQLLLMGNTWGRWEYPEEWAFGTYARSHRRSYELKNALPSGIDLTSEYAHRVWRELLRLTVAMRLWPGRVGVMYKLTTIMHVVRMIGQIVKTFGVPDKGAFFQYCQRSLVRQRFGRTAEVYLNIVAHYHSMGALPDGPSIAKRKGKQPTRDRTGEPEHSARVEDSKQWQPLPDAYTSAAGWRAVQMVRLVGPTLLEALEQALLVPLRNKARNGRALVYVARANVRSLDDVIRKWDWRAPDGSALLSLPMALAIKAQGKPEQFVPWPPTTYSEAWSLLQLLQASHLWLVALSLAARHGEVVEMREGCIRHEDSNVATGAFLTWKLDGFLGRDHEVPLPDIIVSTLRQQVRLAHLVKRLQRVDGDHLWVQMTSQGGALAGERIPNFSAILKKFNSAFDLNAHMGGSRIHMHRFRKTLVRIVALALVHAPKILMDVLGHRDEQMTVMRYILADPGILAEIEELTKELVILKGLQAVKELDHLEGKAAPMLRNRVAQYSKLMGRHALEPQNLREFIEVITEKGGGWAIIGPGKVCTGFKNGGLCNDRNGEANPHYCNAECSNQLIFPDYVRVDGAVASSILEAIETLDYMVDQLRQADEAREDMLIAQFAGQVRGLLRHWREVDQHFRKFHLEDPLVKKHLPKVVLLP